MTVLLREAVGASLRRARTDRRRTLREVSALARVSLGYLSEVERGRKEASSELLAAICEALDLPLSDLLTDVAEVMRPMPAVQPLVPIGTRHTDLRRAALPGGPTRRPATVSVGGPVGASPLVSVAA